MSEGQFLAIIALLMEIRNAVREPGTEPRDLRQFLGEMLASLEATK